MVDNPQALVSLGKYIASHIRVVPPRRHWHEELFNCRPWTWKTTVVQRILGDQMVLLWFPPNFWEETLDKWSYRRHTSLFFSANESHGWISSISELYSCRTQNCNSKNGQWKTKNESFSLPVFFPQPQPRNAPEHPARTLSWRWSWQVSIVALEISFLYFALKRLLFQPFSRLTCCNNIFLQTVMRCTDQ